jgi:uncharacterized iron-regulated protein
MRPLLVLLALLIAFPTDASADGAPWAAPLARNHPLVGHIWLPGSGRFIGEAELAERLAGADFVLLGERHDNPDHHRLEAWALARVIASGRRPRVAFEMIDPAQTAALDRHLADHPGDVDGLSAALDWAHSHWPDWSYYEPLFALAVKDGLPIRAANLTSESVRTVARGQPLSLALQRFYRLDRPAEPAVFTAMAEEIRRSHCGQLPEQAVAPMVSVQLARDAAMAHAMADDNPNGAVLIAGAGHTRTDRGVPGGLAELAPHRPIFSLAFVEVDDEENDPAGYGEAFGAPLPPFDAVWFTPRANDDDPCAEMIDFMKRKTEKELPGAR